MSKILLVDDEQRYAELLQRVLLRDGHQVTALSCSATAMTELSSSHYDLLVTDLDMPQVNGFDLLSCAGARQQPLPVLVITAQKAMLDSGFSRLTGHHCLLKPFSINDFRAKVELLTAVRERHCNA